MESALISANFPAIDATLLLCIPIQSYAGLLKPQLRVTAIGPVSQPQEVGIADMRFFCDERQHPTRK
jgi:hypothetical protein